MAERKKPAKKRATKKRPAKKPETDPEIKAKRSPKGPKAQAQKGKVRHGKGGGKSTRRAAGRVIGKVIDPETEVKKPGKKPTRAQKSMRDSRIVALRGMGFGFEEIAEAVDLSVRQVERNYYRRIEDLPTLLDMEPLEVIRNLVIGYQNSILDFEQMAAETDHVSAAVGAKKGANDARAHLTRLLQATGQLPQELGTLRHIVEVRHVVGVLIDTVESFVAKVESMELDEGDREAIVGEARLVEDKLHEIAGQKSDADEDPEEVSD